MSANNGVFISYSRTDRTFVAVAIQLLRAGGASVFYDVASIEFGDRWEDQLAKAIQRCERMLVFWSAAASVSSWVEKEWRQALFLGKRIVPMQLDTTPLPPDLGQFHGVAGLMSLLQEAVQESRTPMRRQVAPGKPFAAQRLPDDFDPFSAAPLPAVAPSVAPSGVDPLADLFGSGSSAVDPFADLRPSGSIANTLAERFTELLFGET